MPKKTLVIVESPAKAKTLSRYLGSGYEIAASVGHVRDLPKKRLAVDVRRDFEPTYEVVEEKQKTVRELRRRAKSADGILLATDPDREGEAIAYHVAHLLGYDSDGSRFGRVSFREVTKAAVTEAMSTPGSINFNRVDAQQARRVLDRLVGYKVSGRLPRGQSAGRVQTVALRLICEREDDIKAFVQQEYWSITAHLIFRGKNFTAKLHSIDGKGFTLPDESAVNSVLSDLDLEALSITSVRQRRKRKNPDAPFTTSTLQQQAAKRYRFSVDRTMGVAQRLYEGLDVGRHGRVGLITYMRTDSTRLSPEAAGKARRWIGKEFGDSYVPARARLYGGKGGARAQDAHEAIRPSQVSIHPSEAKRHLDPDCAKLYDLIWRRFVASQMTPAEFDTTVADLEVERSARYLFRASGSVLRFDGFKRLYMAAAEEGDHRRLDDLDPLPPLEEGKDAALQHLKPEQHFTKPPPRYSEASLVKKMEEVGIGRPSTYARILSRIAEAGYVRLSRRRFEPTQTGDYVAKLLVRVLPETFNVEFTSQMEARLDRIEKGEVGWRDVLADFYPPFERRLKEGIELGPHPKHGRLIHLRTGPYGAFVALDPLSDEKPLTAPVPAGLDASRLDIDLATQLFDLPRELGADSKTGETVVAGASGTGPFVRRGKAYANLDSLDRVWTVTLNEALSLLAAREGREIGVHPESKCPVVVKSGRYGPYLELSVDGADKPRRASLPPEIDPESVDLAFALRLLALPLVLGDHPESGKPVEAGVWRDRPAVRCERTYADLPELKSVWTVTLDEAVSLLKERQAKGRRGGRQSSRTIKELGKHPDSGADLVVLAGRYGPYVTDGTTNATIPRGTDPETIEADEAIDLLARKQAKGGSSTRGRRRGKARR